MRFGWFYWTDWHYKRTNSWMAVPLNVHAILLFVQMLISPPSHQPPIFHTETTGWNYFESDSHFEVFLKIEIRWRTQIVAKLSVALVSAAVECCTKFVSWCRCKVTIQPYSDRIECQLPRAVRLEFWIWFISCLLTSLIASDPGATSRFLRVSTTIQCTEDACYTYMTAWLILWLIMCCYGVIRQSYPNSMFCKY
jgi:hypothetical protein